MALLAQTPVVEFRFLLSRPIRLSLRTLHSLHRPQCIAGTGHSPQFLAQRRSLCLYKTARAETVLGQHKILPFDPYKVDRLDASEHLVNIKRGGKTIAEGISLKEVYDQHVKPGHLIYSLGSSIPKDVASNVEKLEAGDFATLNNNYSIFEGGSISYNKKDPRKGKGIGALRVTPLMLSSTPDYFKLAIDRSYQFVEQGCPVEFVLRYKQGHVKKEVAMLPTDHGPWKWIHRHFPHLRPDFILRAMPEGSRYVVDPVSNGNVLQFVIAKEVDKGPTIPDSLTKRFFRVKQSVQASIEKGLQAGLPKIYRQQLQEAGKTSYSRASDQPAKLLEMMGKSQPEGQEQDEEWGDTIVSQVAPDRYMPRSTKEPNLRVRYDKLNKGGYLKAASLGKKFDHKAIKRELKEREKAEGGSGKDWSRNGAMYSDRKKGPWENSNLKKDLKRRSNNFIDGNPFKME
jgi:hypothetical protein